MPATDRVQHPLRTWSARRALQMLAMVRMAPSRCPLADLVRLHQWQWKDWFGNEFFESDWAGFRADASSTRRGLHAHARSYDSYGNGEPFVFASRNARFQQS